MTDTIRTIPGLIPDPRKEAQKALDYQHSEIAGAVALNWNRDMSGAPKYSIRNQNGSGSCVAQATAKALEILTGIVESAHPIYRRRANFNGVGMYLQDSGDIEKKQGTTTELLDPSQNMTESEMNADVTVPTPLVGYLYIFPNYKNIDEIAQAIELQKHCKVTIGLTYTEYDNAVKPFYDGNAPEAFHCLCATYYFTDENGEKCILIEESWGPNNITQRIFTESYLTARGTGAMYHLPPATPNPITKPVFKFTKALGYGQTNSDIVQLQNILKYEGLFPQNTTSTGLYGNVTAAAVLKFQLKYNLESAAQLQALKGHNVGPLTIAKLNELYGQ
jgi:hypothetical protein